MIFSHFFSSRTCLCEKRLCRVAVLEDEVCAAIFFTNREDMDLELSYLYSTNVWATKKLLSSVADIIDKYYKGSGIIFDVINKESEVMAKNLFPKARKVLIDMAMKHPCSFKDGDFAPVVVVADLGASSINLVLRVWGKTEDYFTLMSDLNQGAYDTLNENQHVADMVEPYEIIEPDESMLSPEDYKLAVLDQLYKEDLNRRFAKRVQLEKDRDDLLDMIVEDRLAWQKELDQRMEQELPLRQENLIRHEEFLREQRELAEEEANRAREEAERQAKRRRKQRSSPRRSAGEGPKRMNGRSRRRNAGSPKRKRSGSAGSRRIRRTSRPSRMRRIFRSLPRE